MSDQLSENLPTSADSAATPDDAHALVDGGVLPDALPREGMATFIEALAQWGNVRAAALQAGMSRAHLYRLRRACAEFRQLWDAALVLARPQVEEVLADRALNGVQEVVFYHGEEVATRTRFDTRLLLAHLARLDRVEKMGGTFGVAAEFDERLARLREPPVALAWDDADGDDEDDDDLLWDEDDDYDDEDHGGGEVADTDTDPGIAERAAGG